MARVLSIGLSAVLFGTALTFASSVQAEVLCIKKKLNTRNGSVSLRRALRAATESCPRGFSEVLRTDSFQGPQGPSGTKGETGAKGDTGERGPQGPQGPDGQLRIYGDGSSGNLQVAATDSLSSIDSSGSYQFESLDIAPDGNLQVSSGEVIRVRGACTVEGRIEVEQFAFAARDISRDVEGAPGATLAYPKDGAHPGLAHANAGMAEYGTDDDTVSGAPSRGAGLNAAEARAIRIVRYGGGGGGGPSGASGGGSITILCQGALTISGTIVAVGDSASADVGGGGGGGGGGVIILASPTSITNSGTINVSGGNGSATSTVAGPGGGGGGGIVTMIAPTINDSGGVNISGGAGGVAGTVSSNLRFGGGAGGASGGSGGAGGDVLINDSTTPGENGSPGHFNRIEANPDALF